MMGITFLNITEQKNGIFELRASYNNGQKVVIIKLEKKDLPILFNEVNKVLE